MVQGQIFFKGAGGWHFSYLIFSRFLHLEITLSFAKLCYAFEEKNFFLLKKLFEVV